MQVIPENQIAYRKQVGRIGDCPVFEFGLIGGLHLIVRPKGSSSDTLGLGSHRRIARHIAQKRQPDIEWTELSKSDDRIDERHFAHLLPKYESVTDQLRDAEARLRGE